jgi:prepilin-type N-terminal cleavage/methylation domain-containing protein
MKNLKHRLALGFTLLEVMISMAILALALTTIAGINANSFEESNYARWLTVATLLARSKMIDVEEQLRKDGFGDSDKEFDGDFSDEGYPNMKWSATCRKVEVDVGQLVGGLMGGEASAEGLPDAVQSFIGGTKAPAEAPAGGEGGAPSDLSAMLGGGGMEVIFKQVGETLANSIREITLEITWGRGKTDIETIKFVQYVTTSGRLSVPNGQQVIDPNALLPPGQRPGDRNQDTLGVTNPLLMEVALAVTILGVMATLTWGSIARTFDAYETVTGIDSKYHNVRVAMNRMSRELSMAFLTSPRRDKGKERMWETIFKAEPSSPIAKLHFTAFGHQIMRADSKESDQSEIGYYGEADEDNPRQMNLMRREDPRIDREPEEGGRSYVLAEDIKEFKLRFFDPKDDDWTDAWDTEDSEFQGRLPSLVEITMVIEDEGGKELKFVTKTRINLTKELGTF